MCIYTIYTGIYTHIYICTYTIPRWCLKLCIYTYVHVCIYSYICMHIYDVCTCVYIHMHIYAYIYIQTVLSHLDECVLVSCAALVSSIWARVCTENWSRALGLESGFDPSGLDRPGRLPHQQGLCEARLGYRDGSPQLPGTRVRMYMQTPSDQICVVWGGPWLGRPWLKWIVPWSESFRFSFFTSQVRTAPEMESRKICLTYKCILDVLVMAGMKVMSILRAVCMDLLACSNAQQCI